MGDWDILANNVPVKGNWILLIFCIYDVDRLGCPLKDLLKCKILCLNCFMKLLLYRFVYNSQH